MEKIRAETGKNEIGAWLEVVVIDNVTSYYQHRARRFCAHKPVCSLMPGKQTARVYYKPHGVAGFITPWNYPLNNAFLDLVAALIAGNTVLLKPSEITPFTALLVVDYMYQAGIPRDVIQILRELGKPVRL